MPLIKSEGVPVAALALAGVLIPRTGRGRVANWGEVDMQEFCVADQ